MFVRLLLPGAVLLVLAACSMRRPGAFPSYASDAAFLEEQAGGRRFPGGTGEFVVCPGLQGRVMTSEVAPGGASLGYVPREVILHPPEDVPFRNFGGEDRFWIGPEAGPYALYFGTGETEQVEANWRVPAPLQEGAWEVVTEGPRGLTMRRRMELVNRLGTRFEVGVTREIRGLEAGDLGGLAEALTGLDWVGFESLNTLENLGAEDWREETGLLCLWILGMFPPGPETFAILPYRTEGHSPPVLTDYFNPLGPDRVRVGSDFVLFRVDGRYRSKIGMLRDRAQPALGAWDPRRRILTVVRFEPLRRSDPYLSELWIADNPAPYDGDVVNSYNHGGPEPFFELETSSPALSLGPRQAATHTHRTLHVRIPEGRDPAPVVRALLGVDWAEVAELAGWSRP